MLPHINLFVGYSNNISYRINGSSGGVGTAILQYLLKSNKVDIVVAVGFEEKDRFKPVYRAIDQPAKVVELIGSKYVYMKSKPLLDVINAYRSKKIAVVTQPCFASHIRRVAPNVKYLLSLFCGYNISREATEYLISKSKTKKRDIKYIEYRGGGRYPGGFTVHKKDGSTRTLGKKYYELADLLFLEKECRKCRVYISGEADIVLGDAWVKNLENATVMVINTELGDEIVKNMYKEKLLMLHDLTEEDLEKMHKHNLKYKRCGHSRFMKLIVSLFNNELARKYAPFYLLGALSKIRRSLKKRIKISLNETKIYG